MKYCSFSNENKNTAVKYVGYKLNTAYLPKNVPFELVPFLKAAYRDLSTMKDKDGTLKMTAEKAFTFTKQFPQILLFLAPDEEYRSLLKGSFLEAVDLAEELKNENSAQVLLKTLGLDKESQAQAKKAQAKKADRVPTPPPGPSESSTEFEKSTNWDPTIPDTTTNAEISYERTSAKSRKGSVRGQEVNNPITKANSKFRRKLLIPEGTDKTLPEKGTTRTKISISNSPYELRLVHPSQVAKEDRVLNSRGEDVYYVGAIMLYVDKATGKPVRINAEGEVTENGEFLAHSWFRSSKKLLNVDADLAALHAQIIETLQKDPTLSYTLQIKGGYLSYFDSSDSLQGNNLISFLVERGNLTINSITEGTKEIKNSKGETVVTGTILLDIEGYDYLAEARPNALGFRASEKMQKLLSDSIKVLRSNLSAEDKYAAFEDWLLLSHKNLLILEEGNLKIRNGKSYVSVSGLDPVELNEILSNKILPNLINSENIKIPSFENDAAGITTVDFLTFVQDYYSVGVTQLFNNNGVSLFSGHASIEYVRDFQLIQKATKTTVEQSKTDTPSKKVADKIGKSDLTDEQKKAKLKKLEQLKKDREDAKKISEERISNGNLLNKIDSLSSAATESEIKAAETWWSNHPLSKYIGLERMFGIVNAGAVATFSENGITLYAGSNFTDVYHEAWHGFTQLMLTKEEKISLYDEARKILGDISYREVEEELAEDFRKYMLSGQKRVFGKSVKINRIFKRILEALQALFGNRGFITDSLARAQAADSIAEIYENLASGRIMENRGPSWDNAMFVTLDKGIQMPNGQTMSSANSRYVKESMDSALASIMSEMGADVNSLFTNFTSIGELYEELKNRLEIARQSLEIKALELEVQDSLVEAEALELVELNESISILRDAIDSFGTYDKALGANKEGSSYNTIAYHLENSELMSVFYSMLQKEEDSTSELDEVATIEDVMSQMDKSSNEISSLDLLSNRIKLMFLTVPERNKEGNPVKDRFGFNKMYSFNKVYNDVQTALSNIQTKDDLYRRLNELKSKNDKLKEQGRRYNNVYEHVLNEIGAHDSTDKQKQYLSGLMWKGFNLAHIVNKQVFASLENGKVLVKVKDPEGDLSRIRKEVQGRFATNHPDGIDYKKVFKDHSLSSLSKSSGIYKFLSDLGIILDYTMELDSYLSQPEVISKFQYLYKSFSEKRLASFNTKQLIQYGPVKILSNPHKKSGYEGAAGTIKDLFNYVLSLTPGMSISRKIAADGKNVYDLNLNSSLTQVIKALNNATSINDIAENKALAHLDPETNPLTAASYWLDTLFPNGVKSKSKSKNVQIKLQYLLGLFTEENAQKNMALDAESKLLTDIHTMFLTGMVEQFRASDKSNSIMMNVNASLAGVGGPKGLFVKADSKSFSTLLMNVFKRKLQADVEVARMFASKDTNLQKAKPALGMFGAIFKSETLSGELKGNEDFLTLEEVMSFVESEQDLNTWLQETKSISINGEATEVSNQSRFENSLNIYFNSRVEKLLEEVDISKIADLTNPLVAESLDFENNPTASFKVVAKNLLINSWLINTEIAALLVGDLNQYKDANDFIKRYAYTSSGQLFATDESTQNFINAQGNLYAEQALGLDRKNTKQYDGTGNTVILTDLDNDNSPAEGSLLGQEFIDSLKRYAKDKKLTDAETQAYIDSYRNLYNEADAQAYITLDSYRQLAIASQEWDWDIHEPLYKRLIDYAVNGGEVSYKEVIEASKFFPVRKYQYIGPLLNAEVNGKKAAATALHKYSLKPIIPTPKGQAKKVTDIIHDAMVLSNTDYVVFESGSKVNNVNKKVDIYSYSEVDENGVTTRQFSGEDQTRLVADFTDNVNVIHFDYLKDVTKVKDSYKNKSTASSQLRNLLPIGIYENNKVIPGKEVAAEAYEKFIKGLDEYLGFELDKIKKVFESKSPENIKKVVSKIKADLEKKDASEEEIEAVDQLLANGGNIDALPNADKIERIIINIFNRRLVKTKLKGEALVQVSSAFQEKLDSETVGKSNDLRFYTYESGQQKLRAAQTKIALQGDFVKLLALKYKGEPIKTLSRLNEAIKDEEWLNKKDHRRMLTITGVRIPVQGHNSVEVLEIVEFLDPAEGTAIVVPSELPVKSGGDFDVDKLTLFYPRIFIGFKKSNNRIEELTDDLMEAIFGEEYFVALDKEGQAGAQNQMIEAISDIILDESNYLNLIKPNDVNQVKDDSPAYNFLEAKNASKTADEAYVSTALDYVFNIRKLKENSVGKKALGIVAANNVIMSLLTRVEKNLPSFVAFNKKAEALDLNIKDLKLPVNKKGLGERYDSEGKLLKTSVVEQLINGFVDIAKKAWVFNIGANIDSTPQLLSMIALGVNYDYAVALINTPLVKEIFKNKAAKKNPVLLLADVDLKKSSPELQVLKDRGYIDENAGWKNADAFVTATLENLDKVPTTEELLNDTSGKVALAMYLQALPLINSISDLMRSAKIDTVVSASIQDSKRTLKNISNLSKYNQSIINDLFNTSVQGIYANIKEAQSDVLKSWFPIRGLDYSSITDNYEGFNKNEKFKFMKEASYTKLMTKLSNHFTSYIYQNAVSTSFSDLKLGRSKTLQNTNVELTSKIPVPVLADVENGKILINAELLEEKFNNQAKDKESYEFQNGVRFRQQGDFIVHEVNKALLKSIRIKLKPTDADIAHGALMRSRSKDVLFRSRSNYNIAVLFDAVKEQALELSDSDFISKIRFVKDGDLINIRLNYSVSDPSEYKEDIKKLSEAGGAIAIFFKALSERVALQDNFETYEGSLMPYILDSDLAESLAQPLADFAKLSISEKEEMMQKFNRKFKSGNTDYVTKVKEEFVEKLSTDTIEIENQMWDIVAMVPTGNDVYEITLSKKELDNSENDAIVFLQMSSEGIITQTDPSYSPAKLRTEFGIELNGQLDVKILKPDTETTTFTDEELEQLIKKCNA